MKWELKNEKYMSGDEVKRLRKSTEDKALADTAKGRKTWVKHWVLIDLVTRSGLRVAEIADLKIEDLKLLGEPIIYVRNGKGGKQREVLIENDLKKHLKEYIKHEGLKDEDYLITSNKGGKCSTRTLQNGFKRCVKVAGLPDHYSIHSARHTYAVELYRHKKDLIAVQLQLGHTKASTTTIYATTTKDDLRDQVNGAFAS